MDFPQPVEIPGIGAREIDGDDRETGLSDELDDVFRPGAVFDDFLAFLPDGGLAVFRLPGGHLTGREEAHGAPVLDVPGVADQEVYAAVRPEGFALDADGPLCCQLSRVEVMGRDTSVVCSHENCTSGTIRAIIPAENRVDQTSSTVRFSLKPSKVFLFDRSTQERIAVSGT